MAYFYRPELSEEEIDMLTEALEYMAQREPFTQADQRVYQRIQQALDLAGY